MIVLGLGEDSVVLALFLFGGGFGWFLLDKNVFEFFERGWTDLVVEELLGFEVGGGLVGFGCG